MSKVLDIGGGEGVDLLSSHADIQIRQRTVRGGLVDEGGDVADEDGGGGFGTGRCCEEHFVVWKGGDESVGGRFDIFGV